MLKGVKKEVGFGEGSVEINEGKIRKEVGGAVQGPKRGVKRRFLKARTQRGWRFLLTWIVVKGRKRGFAEGPPET